TSIVETSIEETSIVETSIEETSIVETSIEETSIVETSIEETSIVETSIEETSVEETSTEEITEISSEDTTEDAAVEEFNTWDGTTTESVFESENFKVTYSLSSYWTGGFNANIKIENTSESIIQNWHMTFESPNEFSNIWNAQVFEHVDGNYTLKNVGWNQDIGIGQSIEFGVSGNSDFLGFPKSFTLLGETTQKDVADYSVVYSLVSDWGSGFSATISITNNTEAAIEDWELSFDFDRTITNLWNGVITSAEDGHYLISNAGYNSNIAAGQTITFGFNGCDGDATMEPQNYLLTDVSFVADEDVDVDIEIDMEKDSDDDGLADFIEDMIGTNTSDSDSDDDGLSDYVEFTLTETDPLLPDTDADGISDADEDYDADRLTNIEEILLGTSVNKTDSDRDGLSDYEEVSNYDTDATNYDTDGDTLSDGDEILLGLDPFNPISDGITPDAERTFLQTLGKENIETSLLEDNLAIPSIQGNVSNIMNRYVALAEEDVYALNDNRATVGKQVMVKSAYADDADLKLYFDCSAVAENTELFMICKYADREIIPCTTNHEGNTVWTNVSNGIYFVINVELFLRDLEIPVDHYISLATTPMAATFSLDAEDELVAEPSCSNEVSAEWYEENYTMLTEDEYVLTSALLQPMALAAEVATTTSSSSSISGQADIVFVIDSTGSMYGAINNVVRNIDTFVDTLATNYSVKANFALIDYKDITCNEETLLIKNGYSNWFSDVTSFKTHVKKILVTGGGDGPETAIDGLAMAHTLDFRNTANKFVILVTDANYKTNNNYGITSMTQMADMLADAGIVTSVISSTGYKSTYNYLFTKTGGVFGNIYGNFSSVLLELAEKIGEVVNDGSWVILSDYQYIKLDQPLSDDGYSSDGDTLSDKDELGTAVKKDLTAFINFLLQAYGIPEELYEGETSITVYNYTSNPVLDDSDFDGINDDVDSNDTSNDFEGTLYYTLNSNSYDCDVAFSVDYREFFTDNTVYNNDIAVLASLYASDIYVGNHVQVTKGANGGADDAVSLAKLFGLEDVENIFIKASDYSYDKDDITDVVIGHRSVTYMGETREFILLCVRGTNGTNAEWSSNFDVGATTDAYYNKVGANHPDWKNTSNHKGFDVTANRVLTKFEDYINRHGLGDSSLNKTILITGHSRGAGISNILGAHFELDKEYTSFTYTFASPFTTTQDNATSYTTIQNIMNTDDLIPYLPLEKWGFHKYGSMHELSVEDMYENKWFAAQEGTFEWLIGEDYNNDGGTSRTVDAFFNIASNREDLYVIDTSSDGKVNIGNKYHTTTSGANKRKTAVETELDSVKLLRFCNVYVTGSPIKHVEVNYCPAYLMQNLANMASKTGPLTGYDTKGKYATAKASFIASSGFIPGGLIGGMSHPHMPATYYLMVHNKLQAI
ncbi:MAG: VWA domain-containing protein, partial [Lachnospiraceae bacterium]|nr:VWA domain-containing protein [Lachnospiraceae bacterium]